MSLSQLAIDVVYGLASSSDEIADVIASLAGTSRRDIRERLENARLAIHSPIDTSATDATRRAELERILRGRS